MSWSPPPPRSTQEIRKDAVFNRWVIFSPARAKRPSDFKSTQGGGKSNPNRSSCAFCKHHEHECAPEIFRVPANTPDWRIRVIQNLYPALCRNVTANPTLSPNSEDGYEVLPGVGFHDVVIETPDHSVNLSDLPAVEIGDVILAYKERIKQLAAIESIQYVQVFKNHGASAGASMSHSHSQLMGIPFVPTTVSARLDNAKENFCRTGECLLCAIKIKAENLLVEQSAHFFSMVPFAASFPFEIWIIPRDHASHFEQIESDKAVDLGHILKLTLLKLSKQLNDPPFNYMVHTSPLRMNADSLLHAHWFMQIVPQLVGIAGFEMATGCYINPIFPEDAAKVLREVTLPV